MPVITLPDGSQKTFDAPVTAYAVAQSIGAGLAKAAIAAKVDGKLVDTSTVIEKDANVAIVTIKDDDGIEVIRHSTAHLLAQAVKQLFPSAQVTIGPVIEDGFYYDFAFERPFTPEDLEAIEKRMTEISNQDIPVSREVMPRDNAIQFFLNLGEKYKAEIIRDIPAGEVLSLYKQGDFTDLCRGPHVPSTGKLKAFKLMKLAGAYWRGDSKNEMLQRIYGTAWGDKTALDAYLKRLEEAERRDHRKIAKQLELFHVQEEAPGMVFWHNNGWIIYQVLEQYLRKKLRNARYQEVKTPQIIDRTLWERSGHWEKFHEHMFCTNSEHHDYAIKPMNCPGAIQIFNQSLKSYRDLPLRLAEFGACHRNEPSGTLHGIMRVRSFNQDDAHIFCTEDQIQSECDDFNQLLFSVYHDFGFDDVAMNLSTRPEKRVGSDELWDKAESMMEQVIKDTGKPYGIEAGGGAFYGPKIEFQLKDCIGRVWQLGTIQLDFSMPARLGAVYIAESGQKETPVMLHRVIYGSMERFIGILVEHYAGYFPPWLAPTQASILNITDRQAEYARSIEEKLLKHEFRVKTDLRNEKIGFKIREHTLQRVPYLLVVGDREQENGTVSVRTRTGKDLGALPIEAFAQLLQQKIALLGRCTDEQLIIVE